MGSKTAKTADHLRKRNRESLPSGSPAGNGDPVPIPQEKKESTPETAVPEPGGKESGEKKKNMR
jgi:hypothetical protein